MSVEIIEPCGCKIQQRSNGEHISTLKCLTHRERKKIHIVDRVADIFVAIFWILFIAYIIYALSTSDSPYVIIKAGCDCCLLF